MQGKKFSFYRVGVISLLVIGASLLLFYDHSQKFRSAPRLDRVEKHLVFGKMREFEVVFLPPSRWEKFEFHARRRLGLPLRKPVPTSRWLWTQFGGQDVGLSQLLEHYGRLMQKPILLDQRLSKQQLILFGTNRHTAAQFEMAVSNTLSLHDIMILNQHPSRILVTRKPLLPR